MWIAIQGKQMNKKSKAEAKPAEALTGKPKRTRKPAPGKAKVTARAKANVKTKEAPAKLFDFIGKVESIVVKSEAGAETFEFGLRGRHGLRQTLALGTSDAFALNIMAPIVTAAHASDTKIGVRVAPREGGIPQVVEVASRPKLGKGF